MTVMAGTKGLLLPGRRSAVEVIFTGRSHQSWGLMRTRLVSACCVDVKSGSRIGAKLPHLHCILCRRQSALWTDDMNHQLFTTQAAQIHNRGGSGWLDLGATASNSTPRAWKMCVR